MGAAELLYNGSTYDRERGNVEGTLLASAARTATTASDPQTNYNHCGVALYLYVPTAAGGGQTLTVQTQDPVSGWGTYVAFPALTAGGYYQYVVYPRGVDTQAMANYEVQGTAAAAHLAGEYRPLRRGQLDVLAGLCAGGVAETDTTDSMQTTSDRVETEGTAMGQALRRYYRGATLAAMEEVQTGRRLNYHFDHQGTVQCLTDDTGAVTDRFASDAWGVPVKREGTSINRQWYVGNLGYYRQVDQALDYVRARYYGPAAAGWLSADPAYLESGYHYVVGRAAVAVDPSGLRLIAWLGWSPTPPPPKPIPIIIPAPPRERPYPYPRPKPAPGIRPKPQPIVKPGPTPKPIVGKCLPGQVFIGVGQRVLVRSAAFALACCRFATGPVCLALTLACTPTNRPDDDSDERFCAKECLPPGCWLAAAGFPYDSLSIAVEVAEEENNASCTVRADGAMKDYCPGTGQHHRVDCKVEKKWEWRGSIACCPTCEDTDEGPNFLTKCFYKSHLVPR